MSNAVLLALVAIVPLVILSLTSFVKISVVLSLLRNAIGAPDAPSGLVVTGLSLILTFFVMSPVALDMIRAADQPAPQTAPAPAADPWRTLVPQEYQPQVDRAERGLGPLRTFLTKHSTDRDRATFKELGQKLGHSPEGDEIWVLAPAFVATELREAFMIAVLIFVPFLVIDLVTALGLASLGLQSTNPQTIALPLKLLLFVAVDGWRLLLDALLRGYA
ncbi:MAG: flagellar type III secretion system pore protein FliP [Kofleriaceae bacterium]